MRKPRILLEGATYHVTARANHRELALQPDSVKTLFLQVMADAKKRHSFKIINFVLMGNHFHLLVQPDLKTSLSEIMKWILQTFAIRYNKLTGLWGHFWGDRFSSWIVEGKEKLLRVFRYLDENPVRAGLAGTPELWIWGALGLRRLGCPPWLDEIDEWLVEECPEHRIQARA